MLHSERYVVGAIFQQVPLVNYILAFFVKSLACTQNLRQRFRSCLFDTLQTGTQLKQLVDHCTGIAEVHGFESR